MTGGLPNLLVAGVPKAGTGSIFAYLSQHPAICPATEKEVGFFSPLFSGGTMPSLETYRGYFAHCSGQSYLMEATPGYCFGGERVLQAIKDVLGRPRILMILRDPVDRLWSAYTFQRSWGRLAGTRTFEEYIAVCEDQRRQGPDIIAGGAFNGLSIGFYGDYLKGWFKQFPDTMKVVFFDDLASGPKEVIDDLCRWLSIDPGIAASFDYEVRNRTEHPRSRAMAEAMFAVKRIADNLLQRSPALRRAARKAYFSMNSGQPKEALRPQTKERVEKIYKQSNRVTAELLRAHGYDPLPLWLCSA
ncbi:MAG: sulfotransferase domain-containing protein [Actinobacteria bacterium]|nr:sulfotransferase domain-containing protein [Actinomycetota bacterium]MDQ3533873.1 sulfotransferase domain-containing protein [Actinomycetota bacterium]